MDMNSTNKRFFKFDWKNCKMIIVAGRGTPPMALIKDQPENWYLGIKEKLAPLNAERFRVFMCAETFPVNVKLHIWSMQPIGWAAL